MEKEEDRFFLPLDMVNISRGGIAFISERAMREQERLKIRIFLKKKMFKITAEVVYIKNHEENMYCVGAKFFDFPKEFPLMLEKELDEIIQIHREYNFYKRKNLSFKTASLKYLNLSLEKAENTG